MGIFNGLLTTKKNIKTHKNIKSVIRWLRKYRSMDFKFNFDGFSLTNIENGQKMTEIDEGNNDKFKAHLG